MPSGKQWGNSACSARRSARVQIVSGLGVVGRQVARMEVGTGSGDAGAAVEPSSLRVGQRAGEACRPRLDLAPPPPWRTPRARTPCRPAWMSAGMEGFFRVQGLVVVQEGGGGDDGVGEVPLVQVQLLEGAEHPVGQLAPQLALFDLTPPGRVDLCRATGTRSPAWMFQAPVTI